MNIIRFRSVEGVRHWFGWVEILLCQGKDGYITLAEGRVDANEDLLRDV